MCMKNYQLKVWNMRSICFLFQLPFRTDSIFQFFFSFLHCHIYWEGVKQVHCFEIGNKSPGERHVIHAETWGKYNLGWPASLAYSCIFPLQLIFVVQSLSCVWIFATQLVWWVKIAMFSDYYFTRLNKAFFMTSSYKLVQTFSL